MVDNPECKGISLIVDADTERCVCTACLDMCVEITHFNCADVITMAEEDHNRLRAKRTAKRAVVQECSSTTFSKKLYFVSEQPTGTF